MRPPTPIATRLRANANADALDELSRAVPGAHREQGLPSAGELSAVAARIGARHQLLLRTASVPAAASRADTSQRAGARALADALGRIEVPLASGGLEVIPSLL
ncbi:hypothetical protein ACFXKJ_08975 [Kitasatospora indigofera]|uniref:hypothetical protein n=1 Tax=Kitasatospora indigofera TaxID=67307 RepID=UPI0036251D0D